MIGSLKLAPGYVDDAFKLAVEKPFTPEKVTFGEYTFLPWVRSGFAAALESPLDDAVRAVVPVSVTVQDDNATRVDVPAKTLTLRGPGDIVGLDPGQIIRRFPTGGTINAEENMLAHIEFDRPELPWLFSPLAPDGDKVRPWIVLVVCNAAVSQIKPGPVGLPQQLVTHRGELQPLDDSWAWAHAQIIGSMAGEPSIVDRLSDDHGPQNLSRLLCPRKLAPNSTYIVALVPAFDCGVKTARGQSGGTLDAAWTRAADNSDAETEILLPIFDAWQFSTAPAGDFESLAKRLHGVSAPWNVGRRLIDASNPRGSLPSLPPGAPGEVQVLRCALVSPTPIPPDQPPESNAWDAATRNALRNEINRANAPEYEILPRVGPRLYARFQRGEASVSPVSGVSAGNGDWFSQLNTSPMHRIVAGLGTRVVQHDQEELMQAAWLQVGEIRKANEMLIRIQFGRFVGEALHRNHLSKLALGELSQIVGRTQDKVRAASTTLTLRGVVARSAVPPSAMTGAFRRASRLRGPLARFANRDGLMALRQLVAVGGSFRDFRRLYVEPEGVRTLSESAIASISVTALARKLGVTEATASRVFADRLNARGDRLPIADLFAQPLTMLRVREGTLDLGTRAAAQIADRITDALPGRVASDSARAQALAPLLVGIANSGVRKTAARANAVVTRIGRRLPFSPVPSGIGFPINIGNAITRSDIAPIHAAANVRAGSVEAQPRLRFETAVSRDLTAALMRSHAVGMRDAASAIAQLVGGTGVSSLPLTPERPALDFTREALLGAFAPATTVTPYAQSRIGKLPSWLAGDWFADGRIAPIMAAPRFDRAMFAALDAYDREWLIPGLGKIEFTDFVTVLETNPTFTESFLVGLSDEMGRELLWRGYPTDQRGTYFYRFWDEDEDELAQQIHRFTRTPLGTHLVGGTQARVVLVVRGEVVRRYPDALLVAMRAGGSDEQGRPIFIDPQSDPSSLARILFHNHLPPDILLVGFDLSPAQVQTEPWWFLITQNPSGPTFGLDLADNGSVPAADGVKRNDLDWNDLGVLVNGQFLSALARTLAIKDEASTPSSATWPGNAAIVARTLLQNPVRAAFNAHKLIAPALPV